MTATSAAIIMAVMSILAPSVEIGWLLPLAQTDPATTTAAVIAIATTKVRPYREVIWVVMAISLGSSVGPSIAEASDPAL